MTVKRIIRVLIAEDSPVVAHLLKSVIEKEEDMEVIGHAKDGEEAVEMAKRLRPSLITMDIQMPKMDGFEATRWIMAECPTPIIVISSQVNEEELNTTFNALKVGALTILEKPKNVMSNGFGLQQRSIINKIRALSEVRVIRRPNNHESLEPKNLTVMPVARTNPSQILALGTSTGGPEALHYIFSNLPENFPVPIVVVQHITKGFLPGLVNWLQKVSKLDIKIAEHGEYLQKGTIYFAPDKWHLLVRYGFQPQAVLEDSDPIEHFKPSVSKLFSSLAQSYPKKSIAGILTGMGRDGGVGMLAMHKQSCYTFIQNEASSVVFGMPAHALSLKASNVILDLTEIPFYLIKFFEGAKL